MPISDLNDAERSWLEAHLQVARSFVETYATDASRGTLTPETLDAAWSAWIPTALDQPDMANTIVNATGAASSLRFSPASESRSARLAPSAIHER